MVGFWAKPPATLCADPICLCYALFFALQTYLGIRLSVLANLLCMKRVYKKPASSHFSEARNKTASRPADKTLINRSIGDFVFLSVFIGFRLCVLLEKLLGKR